MNPWFRMASDAAFMMWDAQQVMALRVMRMATGVPSASPKLQAPESMKLDALPSNATTEIGEGESARVPPRKVPRKSQKRLEAGTRNQLKSRAKKRKNRSK